MSIRSVPNQTELLNRLMDDYGNSILRMCYLYLKDFQLAEDAAQETFIKVLRSYDSFQFSSSEKTWIVRIAVNTCKNMLRTHWFQNRSKDFDLEQQPGKDPLEQVQLRQAVLTAITELPVKYREVILLYYYQGFKTAEIGEILNIPVSTVSVRLKRAKERLKPELKECFTDE